MSAEAVTVVLHHSNAKGTAKLVLWGIANHHSDQGAWPSIATLAKYANINERRVQQVIRELAIAGEIAIEEQGGHSRHQYKTNRYMVLLTCPADCDGTLQHKTGVQSVTNRGAISDSQGCNLETSGVQPTAPEPNKNLMEPNKNLTAHLPKQFDEFWNAYPKKADKRPAQKAFASALKRSTFEELMAGVIAYKELVKDTDVKFIKNPATWLNADAWENEIQPSAESEAAERARLRKQRDLEASKQFLEEQQRQADLAKPPPNCEHGVSIVRCRKCLS